MFNEEDPSSKEPRVVDLMKEISNGTPYVFPARFFGIASQQQLKVELKISAIQCGFALSQRGSKPDHYFESRKRSECKSYFTMFCRKHLLCDEKVRAKRKLKGIYKTTTELSTCKDKVCPFSFNIACRKVDNRWIMSAPKGKKLT